MVTDRANHSGYPRLTRFLLITRHSCPLHFQCPPDLSLCYPVGSTRQHLCPGAQPQVSRAQRAHPGALRLPILLPQRPQPTPTSEGKLSRAPGSLSDGPITNALSPSPQCLLNRDSSDISHEDLSQSLISALSRATSDRANLWRNIPLLSPYASSWSTAILYRASGSS